MARFDRSLCPRVCYGHGDGGGVFRHIGRHGKRQATGSIILNCKINCRSGSEGGNYIAHRECRWWCCRSHRKPARRQEGSGSYSRTAATVLGPLLVKRTLFVNKPVCGFSMIGEVPALKKTTTTLVETTIAPSMPVPAISILKGLLLISLSAMCSVAVFTPVLAGAKRTVKVVLPPGITGLRDWQSH